MLFNLNDIKKESQKPHTSASCSSESASVFFEGNSLAELRLAVGDLQPDTHIHFFSKGSWSTHNLMEYLVRQIGRCNLYFTTYSIHEETFRNLHKLMDEQLISSVHALLDYRIEKTKAESFQFARNLMNTYGQTKCHAKVMVLMNDQWAVSVTGSSNMTKNRKLEAGVISTSREVAEFYRDYILKNIQNEPRNA